MDPVRIGHVGYLNAWPLVEGLAKLDGVHLIGAPPASMVGLLTGGNADVALVSTADLARSPDPLAVLSAGMIGSDGPILTVRLFSDQPIERIRTIHADTESHTSVALCRLLIAERTGSLPEIKPYQPNEDWPQSVLLIGDKVITNPPPEGRYEHAYDLGELWSAWTNRPMVYAAWACLASRADEPWVASASAIIDRQRRHNATRLASIAARRAPEHDWPAELALTYFTQHVRYDLNADAAEGLERFLSSGADRGALPEAGPLRWAARHDVAIDH